VFEETISTVSSGDPYKIKVRGFNLVGAGPFSDEVTVYAAREPDAPNAPTRVADTYAKDTIDIEWTPNGNGGSGISGYQIWWNGGGTGPVTGQLAELLTPVTTYQATGLSEGIYYRFAIKAVNIVKESNLSGETQLIAAKEPNAPGTPTLDSQDSTLV